MTTTTQTKLEEAILNGEDTAKLREQLNQEQRAEATKQQKAAESQAEAKARIEQELQQRAEQQIVGIRSAILAECREIIPDYELGEIALQPGLLIDIYRQETARAEAETKRAEIAQQISDADARINALLQDRAALAEARRRGALEENVIVGKLGLISMDVEDLSALRSRLVGFLEEIPVPQVHTYYFDDAVKTARLSALSEVVNLCEKRLVAGAQKLKAESGTNTHWRWKPCLAVSSACRVGVF